MRSRLTALLIAASLSAGACAGSALARAGGSAAALSDGSVLIVGGLHRRSWAAWEDDACGTGSTGVATSVRFVPEP